MDIEDVREDIARHAHEQPNEEVCGFVVIPHGKRKPVAVRCVNTAVERQWFFRIEPREYALAEDLGEVVAVYHSHPTTSPDATEADKAASEGLGIPFIIYAPWRASSRDCGPCWHLYTPTGYCANYVGRPYVFGILDCFSLFRDVYRQEPELLIEIPDYPRSPQFWKHGVRLWEPLLPVHGFSKQDRVKKWDLMLFALNPNRTNNEAIYNHCAVYLGDGLMLHHPSERPSQIVPYVEDSGYYVKHLQGIYRHKSKL